MCSFGGFLPHWQCIVHHSIWDLYKNGWTDHVVVLDDEWTWPKEQCVTWGWRSPNGMYYDKNKTGWVKLWRSGKSVRHINEVTLRPARLVLGWGGGKSPVCNQPPRPTQPLPSVGWKMSTGQSSMMLCDWRVQTGMAHSIGSAVFAHRSPVPSTQTHRHTHHATCEICSNRPHLCTACRLCGLKKLTSTRH